MALAVAEFQLLLTQLAADLGIKLERLLARVGRLDQREALAFITDAYPELVTPYLAAAGNLSATWYEEQPTVSTVPFAPVVADLAPTEQLAVSARWALLQSVPVNALQGTSARSVFNASRDTILENVTAETGATWARHASANACSFCRLLATRGAVYASADSATKVVGRGKEMSLAERRIRASGGNRYKGRTAAGGRQTRGTRALGDKYHDGCHCLAIAVRPGDTYEPPPYVEQWERDYVDAFRAARRAGETNGGGSDVKVIVRRMDGIERERVASRRPDSPSATSGGAVPPVKPPKPPPQSSAADEPEGWSGHVKNYVHPHKQPIWPEAERVRRQEALGAVPEGEQLYQHEIEAVEKLQALGETLEWLPLSSRDASGERAASNDFVWTSRDGIKAELKSTQAKYRTIKKRIRRTVLDASRSGVVKENFVIDLGGQELTAQLRRDLSRYNSAGDAERRIASLWVLTRGELMPIDLQ